ncbi:MULTISPECIES: DUF4136 domain-containing protein [unclassified Sphingomonas]|uniref:DUF4136 domain-containing protein n=1 Tax=unclassified Sphingomonas TaxID=196159 RepID=UPI002151D310|nr:MULTISPECIES: DUF4136 domain-containing protein [unclassified Sphingomonas]MCR5872671.1 DUF4136 domain-containing protein [Sphingomonas sp. J344]UUX99045.1 DUF4136 domain-containing protein [Sphingomonas sp. J315]
MNTRAVLALALSAATLAGCSTRMGGSAPVDVTRYHLSQPIPAGTVSVQPVSGNATGPEAQLYLDAVAATMGSMGFAAAPDSAKSDYLATVDFRRTDRGQVRTRPPVTIGIGGGSYGGNVGVGAGGSVGIGSKTRTVYASELSVQLRRRGDNTVIWEGKAMTETLGAADGTQPTDTATKLSNALFKGFPGQSGITITVK